MSTSQVLDRTFHVYRSHFILLAGIGILLPSLLLVLRLAFVPLGYPPRGMVVRNPFVFWTVFLEYAFSWILLYVIGHAITGAATVYAVARLQLGESATIVECYRKTLPRFWRVLRIALNIYARVVGAGIVTYLACVLVVVGAVAASEWVGASGKDVVLWLAIVVGVCVGLGGIFWMLYLYARYCLAIPACVIEDLPVRPALRRSRFLTRESIRQITLIYLLMAVLGLGLSTILWLPGQFSALYFRHAFLMAVVLRSMGSFIAGALAGPIATIAIALVYYDQRIRKEAFDLQVLMDSMPPTESAPVSPAAPDTA
ncbi:MAG TPA: hypothetical protein VE133_01760 [Candidatus Sulfotelmatobacter sp.]|nr:hypothetical protein [Candidatus Sulfotelmatobacter sp.]